MKLPKSGFLDQFKISPLIRFFRVLAVNKREIIYIYIYAIFNGLISLTIPLGIQAIVNLISGGQVTYSWIVLVGVVVLGTLFAGVSQIMQLAINERVQQNIFTRSAFEFAYRIPRLKLEKLKNQYTPELINRFFDTLTIQKGLDKVLIDFSTASFQILFGFILLSFYSPYFIFLSLIFIFLAILIFRVTGPAGIRSALEESKYKYEVAYWLEELGRGMLTFKLSGVPKFSIKKTDNLVSSWLNARKNHFRILMTQFISMVTLKVLVTAGLLIVGGLLVINQQLNIGQFVAAEIIIVILLNSVEKLIRSLETIYDVVIGTEKISDLTDLPLEEEGGYKVQDDDTNNGVSIKAESLNYRSELNNVYILKNIDLEIQKGENVCISGYNGSGKSMLIQVLSGLYEDYSGNLQFNGIPRKNIDINDLRSKVGDNLLDEDVFYGTIKDNITIGREDISNEIFREAVEASGLAPFIKRMPNGYSTIIGPRSFLLSKSIAKSIILARSIVRDPLLMVIEDDFLQFEKNKKNNIIQYLTGDDKSWTLLVVSNDKKVAESCDRMLVLNEGNILANSEPTVLKQEEWYDQILS